MGAVRQPLRVGVLLPTREQAILGEHDASSLLDFARRAEQLGFDSLWTGDSLTARPRLDPLVVLSAVGAVTRRVLLGTAAMTPALRHPLVAASMVSSLDQVSSGRLVLGVGSGFPVPETDEELAAVGASAAARAGTLDEVTALWRTAWSSTRPGAPNHFTGRHWQAEGLDRMICPAALDGPPLWLAAGADSARALERAARLYDGWLSSRTSAESYAGARRRLEDLCRRAGRRAGAVTPALYLTVTVGPDERGARVELDDYLEHCYGRALEQMSAMRAYAWGPSEHCAQRVADYVRAGARHILLRIGSLRPETHLREIADVLVSKARQTDQENT
ncbi:MULTISPECIES: LLM class flavin-dependent oxidoreductase [unclassified Streptomyces]|uniref:LLM class flavin-dependent oxidoreductase n=1 Tax=unclassified Streptomyces TaxID=2593676 RepID=UPI000DB99C7B|nr:MULTISPECIES: LLM class flavin-dependent oxidoreductase [Streptomyces]MYU05936.1 LLM class flavin-dependent oxidoreductase [Streptomyces sp. SID8366]MYU67188.1 LLM class flavin-dependent oxidoreductase [Streptomyces sp. SID69]RAJ63995.1 alkanesulfonate monooxygenase SsuD/methylene tetrahydromethanopterin reductase-like flavin-dependent oxidoreductase (luciferase family) [Streptomyces sp. PsTaAH-130]TXJ79405.1 LLM class flavin-dependent oxidoreductase [Streptomyces lavendulae]